MRPGPEEPVGAHAAVPAAEVLATLTDYITRPALEAVTALGIIDVVAPGPRTAEDIASATRANAAAVYRVLRYLASKGVFTQVGDRAFALTEVGELLRSDVPGSMRYIAIRNESRDRGDLAMRELRYTLETGLPAYEHVFGESLFAAIQRDPELRADWHAQMRAHGHRVAAAILPSFEWDEFATVVDVGGNTGVVLASLLKAHPSMRGILFDLPEVVEEAAPVLEAHGVAGRCEVVAGDFFAAVPDGGDLYVLSQILHDWDDARASTILANCVRAMKPGSRVAVIEQVVPPGDLPHPSKRIDLALMVNFGGQERSESEFRVLFAQSGAELSRVIPSAGSWSILEGMPLDAGSSILAASLA